MDDLVGAFSQVEPPSTSHASLFDYAPEIDSPKTPSAPTPIAPVFVQVPVPLASAPEATNTRSDTVGSSPKYIRRFCLVRPATEAPSQEIFNAVAKEPENVVAVPAQIDVVEQPSTPNGDLVREPTLQSDDLPAETLSRPIRSRDDTESEGTAKESYIGDPEGGSDSFVSEPSNRARASQSFDSGELEFEQLAAQAEEANEKELPEVSVKEVSDEEKFAQRAQAIRQHASQSDVLIQDLLNALKAKHSQLEIAQNNAQDLEIEVTKLQATCKELEQKVKAARIQPRPAFLSTKAYPRPRLSSTITRPPPPVESPREIISSWQPENKVISVNADGHRIDVKPIKDTFGQEVSRDVLEVQEFARNRRCGNGGRCRDPVCIYGHHCPKGRDCPLGQKCKFAQTHTIDLKITKIVA